MMSFCLASVDSQNFTQREQNSAVAVVQHPAFGIAFTLSLVGHCLELSASVHDYLGSLREKRGHRSSTNRSGQLRTINFRHVPFYVRCLSTPYFPRRVTNPILQASTTFLCCIAPVMLSDELLVRTFYRSDRASGYAQIHSVPTASGTPSVLHYKSGVTVPVDLVRHGQSHVILVIKAASDRCN